jgi:hypothetical protein
VNKTPVQLNSAQLLALKNSFNQEEDTLSSVPFDFIPNQSHIQQTEVSKDEIKIEQQLVIISEVVPEIKKMTKVSPLPLQFLNNGMDNDEIEKLNTVLGR